ncbi:MAG: tRNA (adenosine(37)-N6)-dimethylallyltransferase MiaA [Chitinophagaceae bacterium]
MALPKSDKTVIIVAGPTAVGKTAVAIEIAKTFGTEIISADSRQCFKEMNIGVARPSIGELKAVKHHFIATHSVKEEVTAVTFEQYALQKVANLFQHHDVVVMTGGTGLYIMAFCEGLDAIPDIPVEIRAAIINQYEKEGMDWLKQEVEKKDPQFYKEGETQNPQRMMRALEVMEATGSSILDFRKGDKKQRPFNIKKIGLELPKEELKQRINARVDKMMEAGLLDEVKTLLPHKNLNALQTVGYAEIIEFFENKITMAKAVEEIKIHTRQYAKRQMTWFKKDKDIVWFSPAPVELIIATIKKELALSPGK